MRKKEKPKKKTKSLPKRELAKYRKLLLKVKKSLLEGLFHIKDDALNKEKSQKDASGDLSGYSYHMADMASDQYERDFLLRLAADERERLYEIDDAIKRIEDEAYGFCLTCSKPIGKKRLNALPQAACCLKCQADEEARTK